MLGADGYSPITNVKVTCLDVVRGLTHSRVFDSVVGISGVLTGLIPGLSRQCFIGACNKVGESPSSETFNVTTHTAGYSSFSIHSVITCSQQHTIQRVKKLCET